MKSLTLLAGLAALALNVNATQAAVVMTATDWSGFTNVTTTKNVGASNTFSASGTTEMQIFSSLVGGSAETQRLVWDSTFSYDPGVSGAVDSIDFSIDQRRVGGTPGAHGWGVGFMQDSNVFLFSGYHAFGAGTYSWNTWDATDITASTYWLQATAAGLVAPTATLDLSASGNEIYVGVFIFSGNGGSPTRNDTTAYDNLSVSFNAVDNAVPAPGALALLLTGLAGFGWTRRQTPHISTSN
ncbi:MAG: PEP-CTERM sorting domain-containing protein [Chromatiales bacterium]|nr:PEP-CTERM sorting domain-containing protein [Gammaproteobacteria bacterium]MCP5352930.1 PEP-CTERM sorting domain-containing protein [Chromatiales bacterium]